MTFLEQLQSHKGGLLRLKTELYWYGGRGWDKNPGRICLILDAATGTAAVVAATAAAVAYTGAAARITAARTTAALLLIDGSPHWVWVAEQDVALI